jgi:hypothetical protein
MFNKDHTWDNQRLILCKTYSVAPHQQQGNFLPAQNIPSSYQHPLPNEANEWENLAPKRGPELAGIKEVNK